MSRVDCSSAADGTPPPHPHSHLPPTSPGHPTQGVYIIRWDFNEGFLFHVAHRNYLPLDVSPRARYFHQAVTSGASL
jgi:hypothetical protein